MNNLSRYGVDWEFSISDECWLVVFFLAGRVGIVNENGGNIFSLNRKVSATALKGNGCSLFKYWKI